MWLFVISCPSGLLFIADGPWLQSRNRKFEVNLRMQRRVGHRIDLLVRRGILCVAC